MSHTILPAIDEHFVAQARSRLDQLTKPQGSLGKLEDIAAFMCGWQQTLNPQADKAYTLIFAGNHGVAGKGVSAYPAEVTAQMVANFKAGGAAINQLCREIPSQLRVISLALEQPTQDFTTAPAMSASECEEAFLAGKNAVPDDADILILGEMGIGNTTPAAAIASFLTGGEAKDWVGRGTGIDDAHWQKKCLMVEQAVNKHRRHIDTPMELLAHLGGRELAAIAGAVQYARSKRIPVILDGYVTTAAASALTLKYSNALDHCIAGHLSVEPGHAKLLKHVNLPPLLDLSMRLGEGSGAQIALAIIRAALATFNHMATFDEAKIDK